MSEILDYIEEHLIDIKEAASMADDDDEFYEGSIQTLEHLLAKFGRDNDAAL